MECWVTRYLSRGAVLGGVGLPTALLGRAFFQQPQQGRLLAAEAFIRLLLLP